MKEQVKVDSIVDREGPVNKIKQGWIPPHSREPSSGVNGTSSNGGDKWMDDGGLWVRSPTLGHPRTALDKVQIFSRGFARPTEMREPLLINAHYRPEGTT